MDDHFGQAMANCLLVRSRSFGIGYFILSFFLLNCFQSHSWIYPCVLLLQQVCCQWQLDQIPKEARVPFFFD